MDIILRDLGIEDNSKVAPSPIDRQTAEEVETEYPELDPAMATLYRAVVARANYLSQDRSDIRYAVKELSRSMSKPTERDYQRLKRFGRYLKGVPRLVAQYPRQDNVAHLDVWVDTDWAGCRKTRKSTSGGMAMLGSHIIKHWSTTQTVVATSSGEAE